MIFIIYDPVTGAVEGSLSFPSYVPEAEFLAHNTPPGKQTAGVEEGHDAVFHPNAWKIEKGKPTKVL